MGSEKQQLYIFLLNAAWQFTILSYDPGKWRLVGCWRRHVPHITLIWAGIVMGRGYFRKGVVGRGSKGEV